MKMRSPIACGLAALALLVALPAHAQDDKEEAKLVFTFKRRC